jgi:hypothetical protein
MTKSRLALTAALIAPALAVPAIAQAQPKGSLPPTSGKLVSCHKTLWKVSGSLPVHTQFGTQKGKHPAKSLLNCANANAVATAGKKYYTKPPFHTGQKVKVKGVTYTFGRAFLPPGPTVVYGWAGGGAVIYLRNPTGA